MFFSHSFSRWSLPLSALTLALTLGACNTTSQEVNVVLPSVSSPTAASPEAVDSIFRALGGAGLNPTVGLYCDNQTVSGDRGYARKVARTYRGYINKLLAETQGGSVRGTASVYDVDPVTGLPMLPEPEPSMEPSVPATPEPTIAPTLPPNEDDISVVEKSTLNGRVYDDTQAPLDGVTVVARSLNASVEYEVSTTTAGGTYAFNNVPAGVQLEIIASRSGYGSSRRVEVMRSNKQGDPDANRYDFGNDGVDTRFGSVYTALSDKPSVTQVMPFRSALAENTPITLVFSEPMDRETVNRNFAIYTPAEAGTEAEKLYTSADFEVTWSDDDTKVTFLPKAETDLISGEEYVLGFQAGDGQLRDKSGMTRAQDYFKLGDSILIQEAPFSIAGFNIQQLQSASYQPLPPPVKARDSFFFSYDDSASTASVELFKHAMDNYQIPEPAWSKTWEFLNYETFDQVEQESIGLFRASMGLWKYPHLQNPYLDTYEVGVHLSAPYKCKATRQQMNLTVLVDVSTSMGESLVSSNPSQADFSKQDLMLAGLKAMAGQLKAGDKINLIVFNNSTRTLLEDFEVEKDDQTDFLEAIEGIRLAGGTNLQEAMSDAYAMALKHYDTRKMNRVLLLTDARATEGNVDLQQIEAAAAAENTRPIYLSGLGLGADHDTVRMNQITEAGHGAYYSVNTLTDMHEAMGNRFIPLMDAIARNVRFKLEFPGFMRHNKSAAEEVSSQASEVQPTTFSANTSQYFWEQFLSNKTDFAGDEKVVLTITYEDPRTRQQKTERLEKSLAEILDKDLQNLKAAHMVSLTTALVRREVSASEVQQELDQLLPDVGR